MPVIKKPAAAGGAMEKRPTRGMRKPPGYQNVSDEDLIRLILKVEQTDKLDVIMLKSKKHRQMHFKGDSETNLLSLEPNDWVAF